MSSSMTLKASRASSSVISLHIFCTMVLNSMKLRLPLRCLLKSLNTFCRLSLFRSITLCSFIKTYVMRYHAARAARISSYSGYSNPYILSISMISSTEMEPLLSMSVVLKM